MTFIKNNITYIAITFAILIVGIFAVLPVLSNGNGQVGISNISLSSNSVALAYGGGGGDGGCCGGGNTGGFFGGGEGNPLVTPPTPPTPAPSCTISSSPSTINNGQSTTLSWTSRNAQSARIDNSIGSVSTDGSVSVTPSASTIYTMTVTGAGGTASCSTRVLVTTPPPVHAPTCYLDTNKTSVQKGDSVTFSWGSSYANRATFSTFGSVSTVGSRVVYPQTSGNYTLTVYGNGGQQTCSAHISVYTPPIIHHNPPSCTINTNVSSVQAGNPVNLSWSSTNATSAYINEGIGSVSFYGSRTVYPYNTKNYIMTVYNASGERATCTKTVGVYTTPVVYHPPIVTVAQTNYTPAYDYVRINQVPYTGTNDVAYVLTLIAVALASVGAVVYFRGNIAYAFAGLTGNTPVTLSEEVKEDTENENENETEGDDNNTPTLSLINDENGPRLSF